MKTSRKKNVNDYSRFANLEDSDDEKEREEEARKKREKVTKTPSSPPPRKKQTKPSSPKAEDVESDDDEDLGTQGFRGGYKTRADGTKVLYDNNLFFLNIYLFPSAFHQHVYNVSSDDIFQ